ncbi:pitrilysin family protein [Nonomuraea sp. C10]|uniref:M16 family metallopeptidase n=1 Tax=Nonomuraea sp. C10 TaxID=2600577 RepID=UPI0011CDF8C8|nr:pitrilysin family protein [Nonomuraea sp. C10]TXK39566.1 insulinase family protein [Nonomuraea sp. C10]
MSRPVHVAERGAAPAWLAHRPGAAVTTVSVWLRAGSRHERPGVEGGTHLLEHILMQVPSAGGERVIDLLEDLGGEANAITSREHLVLYARVPSEEAAAALDILARALAEPELSAPVLEAERKVVQEELRLAAADPLDVVHDIFFGLAYPGHPLGRPVGGTIEEVDRLELDALRDHHRRFLGSAGVVVCGGADPDDLLRVLDKGPLAALPPWQEIDPGEPPAWGGGREALRLNADTTGVVLGGPAAAYRDPLRHRWPVLMELLAGASSALLTEELRNRRGLCYELWPMVAPYRDAGTWRVFLATAPEHLDEVVDRATELLAEPRWTEAELTRAARRAAGLLRLEAEQSLEEVLLYGKHALVAGTPHWTLADELAAIEAVREPGLAEIPGPLAVATAGGA